MTKKTKTTDNFCDVLVVGGALAGLSAALAMARLGLAVVVVDADDPAKTSQPGFDGRTTAISYGSAIILDQLGIWQGLKALGSPIATIRVADEGGHVPLIFAAEEVGAEAFGWIVENHDLRLALAAGLRQLPNAQLLAPAQVAAITYQANHADIRLADGRVYRSRLVIGADGRNSITRAAAKIDAPPKPYGQTAIVCNITHSQPHQQMALELFRPSGPFAVLPLRDCQGVHRSSVVWTEHGGDVDNYLALSDADFNRELQQRAGDYLGRVAVAGGRYAWPLRLQLAASFIGTRLALVNEAAHVIHPIAGQGLNLGLRDIAALAELVAEATALGLDIGAPTLLQRYDKRRRFDTLSMVAATDGLNKLFGNNLPWLRGLRGLGLGAVGRLPILKKFFMRQAMGLYGAALPASLRAGLRDKAA